MTVKPIYNTFPQNSGDSSLTSVVTLIITLLRLTQFLLICCFSLKIFLSPYLSE